MLNQLIIQYNHLQIVDTKHWSNQPGLPARQSSKTTTYIFAHTLEKKSANPTKIQQANLDFHGNSKKGS
jgi:hypothetical protein